MIKTLFDNYEFEKEDFAKIYAKKFIEELNSLPKSKILVNENTDHGFSTNEKISLVSGIYLLYKYDILIYVGQSNHCIRQRIGRFLAGIRGTERFDENHSAAYKYIQYFSRDTKGLSFKYIGLSEPGRPVNLDFDVTLNDIEKIMIKRLNPLFNDETYSNFSFEKVLKVSFKNDSVNSITI
jgi:hypothetical protein